MNEFERQLERLKALLNLTEDQQVAELLGISKAALSQRKSRDSFPADKLRLLAAAKPELRINVDYVLNGSTRRATVLELKEPPKDYDLVAPLQVDLYSRTVETVIAEMGRQGVELSETPRSRLYQAAYEMALPNGEVNPRAVELLVRVAAESQADAKPKA